MMQLADTPMSASMIAAIEEQFGAAFAMMEAAISQCPDQLWADASHGPAFWHVAYHALFYMDFYLSGSRQEREAFRPFYDNVPQQVGVTPSLELSKGEIQNYFSVCHQKARKRFLQLTTQGLQGESVFEWHGNSVLSSLLYNLRHFMLHIGTLNYRILRVGVELTNWVSHQKMV